MSKTDFKIVKSYEKKDENDKPTGAFITKLQRTTEFDHPIFGKKVKTETLNLKGTKQVKEGTIIKESDLFPHYVVKEYPGEIEDEKTGEMKQIITKWLHVA